MTPRIVLALMLFGLGCKAKDKATPPGPAVAKAAPALPARARDTRCDGAACLPDLDFVPIEGDPILAPALGNKIVLVSFWASYCEPCTQEAGGLSGVFARHHKEGFEMLGISLDKVDDDKLRTFAAHYSLQFPIVRATPEILHAYGDPTEVPTTMLFGRDGKRVWIMTGVASDVIVESDVAALVRGEKVTTTVKKAAPEAATGDAGAASHTM